MNIAINTRLLIKDKLEGIGWFTYEVLYRMVINHPEHQFYFIFDRPYSKDFLFAPNIIPIVIAPQARHPFLYKIWFDYSIPRVLKKYKISVFFSPDGFLSKRTSVPQIPVIHDLNFEHFPKDLPKKDSNFYKKNFPIFSNLAAHIITVSEFSKLDIHRIYAVPLHKITVAYNGVNDEFLPISINQAFTFKSKFSNGSDYFVYVGALHKRKNIQRMLFAFDKFKDKSKNSLKLVIVGTKMFRSNAIEKTYNQLVYKDSIVFTGRLSKSDLVNVIAASKGLVYVSYFEGFGIPIIEAMKCGVPVLTSNTSSMPEVAGKWAILINPFSVEAIAEGMLQMSTLVVDEQFVKQRTDYVTKFNWNVTANTVWDVITKVTTTN